MKAQFKLDRENNRFEFEAADFSLRFAISHIIQKIETTVYNSGGVLELVCSGNEEYIDLAYLAGRLGINWDFSKYDIEVIM